MSRKQNIPANICLSRRCLQGVFKMSWRRLQYVLSVTILRLPRRLEDVLKESWKTKNCYVEDVSKTSWRHFSKTYWRHVLKTSWKHVLKMYSRLKTSWRHYGDVFKTQDVLKTLWRQTKYLLGIFVSNKSKYVSSKSIFHKFIADNSNANPKCSN